MNGGNRSINISTRLSQVHKFRHRRRRRCWCGDDDADSGSGSNCAIFISIHAVSSCSAHHSTMKEKVANQKICALFEEKVPLALTGPTCICTYVSTYNTCTYASLHTQSLTYRRYVNCNEEAARTSHATRQISWVPTIQLRIHKAFVVYWTCFTQLSACAL